MPKPENFSLAQKLTALRRGETLEAIDLTYLELCVKQKMKERNLAYTRYKLSIFEIMASDPPMRRDA
jgi:hypothetical protein